MSRKAVTLVEVLAAIFITGIGLLSLLTLFPLGALSMAQALQDGEAARAAQNAKAIADGANPSAYYLSPAVGVPGPVTPLRKDQVVLAAMLGLDGSGLTQLIQNGVPVNPEQPGWPVLVDPTGRLAYTGLPQQNWVGATVLGVPRRGLSWLDPTYVPAGAWITPPAAGDYLRWCSLLDDINWVSDGAFQGLASDPALQNVQRRGRYSYAWFCRMPRSGNPTVIDVSVVVYSGRSLDLSFDALDQLEDPRDAVFDPTTNQITVTIAAGADKPNLRRGGWVLDATMQDPVTGKPHGYFYRVVNVIDTSTAAQQQVVIEVQTQLKDWTAAGQGKLVIFDNVIEVFDAGTF